MTGRHVEYLQAFLINVLRPAFLQIVSRSICLDCVVHFHLLFIVLGPNAVSFRYGLSKREECCPSLLRHSSVQVVGVIASTLLSQRLVPVGLPPVERVWLRGRRSAVVALSSSWLWLAAGACRLWAGRCLPRDRRERACSHV